MLWIANTRDNGCKGFKMSCFCTKNSWKIFQQCVSIYPAVVQGKLTQKQELTQKALFQKKKNLETNGSIFCRFVGFDGLFHCLPPNNFPCLPSIAILWLGMPGIVIFSVPGVVSDDEMCQHAGAYHKLQASRAQSGEHGSHLSFLFLSFSSANESVRAQTAACRLNPWAAWAWFEWEDNTFQTGPRCAFISLTQAANFPHCNMLTKKLITNTSKHLKLETDMTLADLMSWPENDHFLSWN